MPAGACSEVETGTGTGDWRPVGDQSESLILYSGTHNVGLTCHQKNLEGQPIGVCVQVRSHDCCFC